LSDCLVYDRPSINLSFLLSSLEIGRRLISSRYRDWASLEE
jgi:hypothetical protein